MKEYRVAVDLGATKILVGIVDESHNVVYCKQILTEKEKGFEHAMQSTAHLVKSVCEDISIDVRDCTVGMCAPGPIDVVTGEMVHSVNFCWGVVPLRDRMQQLLSVPVVVEHDAKAAALGEFHYGVGQDVSHMVYIVVGSGVGGAIIIDNKLYRGEHNFSGEVGHITLDYDGDSGATGIKGNAQSFMSGPSLVYYYKKYCKEIGVPLQEGIEIDGKYVGLLAQKGDEIALKVMEKAGKALGVLVGSLAMVLDIKLFVIGSSVVKIGSIFLNFAREEMPAYTFKNIADNVRIQASTLGDNAALLGCAHVSEFEV